MENEMDLSSQIVEVYKQLTEKLNDVQKIELQIKNSMVRYEKSFVYVFDKKEKCGTHIIKRETDKSLLNRMKQIEAPLELCKDLIVEDDLGGHKLTKEEFQKFLNNKDLEMKYFDCLTAEDILNAINE